MHFVAQGPAKLISPVQTAASHDVEGLQDLFMENCHPVSFFQDRFEVLVGGINLRSKAMPMFQEGSHHVGFHGSGPEK